MALMHPSAEVLAHITSFDEIAAHVGLKDAPRNAMYEALGIDDEDVVDIIAILEQNVFGKELKYLTWEVQVGDTKQTRKIKALERGRWDYATATASWSLRSLSS